MKLAHALRRGDTVEVTIDSLANGGDGVAKIDGVPVFIDRAAVGDKLSVRLFDVRKDFARGEITKVLQASPERIDAPCKHYDWCGGCQWQHIDYAAQLKHKDGLVRQALKYIGGLDTISGGVEGAHSLVDLIEPIAGAGPGEDFHYRNKAQFPVQYVDGQFRAGYFARGSHELVNVEHCLIQPAGMDGVLRTARTLLKKYRVHAYDESDHSGLVRHINLRQSIASGQQLVTIVINHAAMKFSKLREDEELRILVDVAGDLVEAHPEIEGVVLNFNPNKGNRILGDDSLVLIGTEYVEEQLKTQRGDLPQKLQDGFKLRLSSSSFFQVNTSQAVRLLEIIADMVRDATAAIKAPIVVDAYAGVGTISFWLSPLVHKVIAVEENREAVADGVANANLNGINNIEFLPGRVEDFLAQLTTAGAEGNPGTPPDLLIVDPPRKGLSPEVLYCIKESGPQHLIYVSCNPTTLARDLKILAAPTVVDENGENVPSPGYKAKRVKPVDLFPQTYHVETVVLLERF